LSYIGSYYSCK